MQMKFKMNSICCQQNYQTFCSHCINKFLNDLHKEEVLEKFLNIMVFTNTMSQTDAENQKKVDRATLRDLC